jgi:hypothetical protein
VHSAAARVDDNQSATSSELVDKLGGLGDYLESRRHIRPPLKQLHESPAGLIIAERAPKSDDGRRMRLGVTTREGIRSHGTIQSSIGAVAGK